MNAAHEGKRWRLPAALATLFLLVVAGRTAFVSLYAESVPYWDQWDAEGANLIRPWLDGTLTVTDLFATHNEHRILFTRLLSLALFEANDRQWDNLVGAYANVFVYAAIPVLLFALFAPGLRTLAARLTLFFALLALAWLPYSQHNTLIAFQSQFFFMSLLAIGCVWGAARARDDAWLPIKVLPAALLGLFTMASGLLGAVAAGGVLALRLAVLRTAYSLRTVTTIGLLATIAIAGYAAVPHIAGHEPLKAHDAATWLQRFVSHSGWPLVEGSWLAWIPVWMPSMIGAYRLLRHRDADAHELAALGLCAWTLMQVAAIAYSRDVLGDRYFDTLVVGLVANLWLAVRLIERGAFNAASVLWRRVARAIPLLLLFFACASLLRSAPSDIRAAARRTALSTLQTINVRQFVALGDRSFLDSKLPMQIPYPSPDRLASLLSDPVLRQALPASVRTPLPLTDGSSNGFKTISGDVSVRISSCVSQEACREQMGAWLSQPMHSRFPYLLLPMAIDGAITGLSLSLAPTTSTGEISPHASRRGWLLLHTPASSFQLRSKDASPRSSLLFRAPIEVGSLSAMAMSLQDRVRTLFGRSSSAALQHGLFFVESPASVGGGRPLRLDAKKLVQIEWSAPRSGELATVSTMIGNYFYQSDGLLALQACSPSACRSAQTWLRDSVDIHYFGARFDNPLDVRAGEPLVLKFWTYRATSPVAIFGYDPAAGSPRIVHFADIPPVALAGTTVRLRLGFVD